MLVSSMLACRLYAPWVYTTTSDNVYICLLRRKQLCFPGYRRSLFKPRRQKTQIYVHAKSPIMVGKPYVADRSGMIIKDEWPTNSKITVVIMLCWQVEQSNTKPHREGKKSCSLRSFCCFCQKQQATNQTTHQNWIWVYLINLYL